MGIWLALQRNGTGVNTRLENFPINETKLLDLVRVDIDLIDRHNKIVLLWETDI